jgi:hypothetical protein
MPSLMSVSNIGNKNVREDIIKQVRCMGSNSYFPLNLIFRQRKLAKFQKKNIRIILSMKALASMVH